MSRYCWTGSEADAVMDLNSDACQISLLFRGWFFQAKLVGICTISIVVSLNVFELHGDSPIASHGVANRVAIFFDSRIVSFSFDMQVKIVDPRGLISICYGR